jgi:hypothetical protein
MKYTEENYPKWLKELSFGDCFDWEESIRTTFSHLLEHITLHDSYWCEMHSYADNSLNLIINFDAIWNTEILGHKGPAVKEWPYLIIKINRYLNLISNSNQDCGTIIAIAHSELIENDVIEKFQSNFDKNGLINPKLIKNLITVKVNKTTIEDVCGGFIEILHDESINVLLYSADGNLISFPDDLNANK